jgi:hypothetical protein
MRPAGADADLNKVTHQGCLDAFADASLLACDPPSTCETIGDADSANDTAAASVGEAAFAALVCRRCAQPLRPHLRQGYLRAGSVRWRSAHDHPS